MDEMNPVLQEEKTKNNNEIQTNTFQESNTNCLALIVKEDYKIIAIKNMINKGFNVSWKVILSTIVMNFLNLFL